MVIEFRYRKRLPLPKGGDTGKQYLHCQLLTGIPTVKGIGIMGHEKGKFLLAPFHLNLDRR